MKTGRATESNNQSIVYDSCQSGTAVGCGPNASTAGYGGDTAPRQVYIITPN